MKTPIYLRDLKPEYQSNWLRAIVKTVNRPELQRAFEDDEDIIVGYYIDKPKIA